MDTNPVEEPNDLPDLWVVPLNEPPPPAPPSDPAPPGNDGPVITLFQPDDPPSDVGFHPLLRRFDEAA